MAIAGWAPVEGLLRLHLADAPWLIRTLERFYGEGAGEEYAPTVFLRLAACHYLSAYGSEQPLAEVLLTAAAPLIGVTADRTWPGLSPGVLIIAHHWAEQGYKVLVVDAELGAGELTRWAVDAGASPFDGSVERVLREHQGTPRSVSITVQLAELLNAPVPQGSVELVAAYDKPPTGYPSPPGGRDVLLLHRLIKAQVEGTQRLIADFDRSGDACFSV